MSTQNPIEPRFCEFDAWLLVSIMPSCTLTLLVGIAESVNHPPLSVDELNAGLNRLIAAGYITADNGIYQVTPKGLKLYGKVSKPGDSVYDETERVTKLLQVESTLTSVPVCVTITSADLHAASIAWHEQHRQSRKPHGGS